MKKIKIDKIDKNEVLRYLGRKDIESLDEHVDSALEKSLSQTLGAINPRATHVFLPINTLDKAGLLEGKDILCHLEGCTHAILLALTLGGEIEQKIRMAQATDVLFAVMLDACASVAAEAACDKYTGELLQIYNKKELYLTDRFSPGYGDFPIEKQQLMLTMLDAGRKIGLYATSSHILTPRKSVTAVIGVADFKVAGKLAGCENCALKENCEYKKRGTNCNV